MNMQELKDKLNAECYNSYVVYVGPDWHRCADTYCLSQEGNIFEVFYVERGKKGEVLGAFEIEQEACDFFYKKVSSEKWNRAHCLGLFTKETDAIALAKRLKAGGIRDVYRDTIPHTEPYRVFVFGTDLIKAKNILE